ncbi:MAG: hypothetical protein FJ135_03235 [Deltaproteobacteria bacterium]|nr:hypothetical protein [Deltaproteobacteria bacterium]
MNRINTFIIISLISIAMVFSISHSCFAQKVKLLMSSETDMSGDHSYTLVGGRPNKVEVGHINTIRNLDFKKPWRKNFPKADYYFRDSFKEERQLSGGGQRFIFQFLIQDGCRACDPLGSAYVAYDFDATGRFLGTKILRFTKETNYRQ